MGAARTEGKIKEEDEAPTSSDEEPGGKGGWMNRGPFEWWVLKFVSKHVGGRVNATCAQGLGLQHEHAKGTALALRSRLKEGCSQHGPLYVHISHDAVCVLTGGRCSGTQTARGCSTA